MPKVKMTPWAGPSVVRPCPHVGPNGMVHEWWHSRDGMMGVCQMSDNHLNNAIKMLLRSMQAIASHMGEFDYDPDYQITEMKLEILNRERHRRQMVLKGWASEMSALEPPKTEIIQGNCSDLECQNGCQGNCLVRVLAEPSLWPLEGWPQLGNSEIEVRTRLLEAEAERMGLFPGFGEDDDLIYDEDADPNMSRAERDAQRRGQL